MFNRIHRQLSALSFAVLLGIVGAGYSAAAQAETTLYQQLGERTGVQKIVSDLIDRAVLDPRIAGKFKDVNKAHLKSSISDQICSISGGPCQYEGPTMKEAHADMGLRKADFLALVDDLEQAMKAQGIPFHVQTKLLALLAPMHRDVVTEH